MDFLQQFISFPMGPSPSGLVGQAPPTLPPPLWVFSPMGATPTEEHALKDHENHSQFPTTTATAPFSLSLCIDQRDQLGSSHSSTTTVWPQLDWSHPFLSSLGCETNCRQIKGAGNSLCSISRGAFPPIKSVKEPRFCFSAPGWSE